MHHITQLLVFLGVACRKFRLRLDSGNRQPDVMFGMINQTTESRKRLNKMQQQTKAKIYAYLRKIHAWVGIFVFPLVLIVGFTGFYLNHSKTIFAFINATDFDESVFETMDGTAPANLQQAKVIALGVWPGFEVERITGDTYHDWPSYIVELAPGKVIVSRETGHYYTKTDFRRRTYAPDGTLLHSKFYWGSLFKWLHVRGWPGDRFGTLLSDITSVALIVFSLSGMFLWWMPRARKIKRRLGIAQK